jgi:hypothetical protein
MEGVKMAETLHQTEATPAAYPNVDYPFLWHRIEAYTARRWTPRNVTWLVRGPGEWVPPLAPAEVVQAYIWTGDDWAEITLATAPRGFDLQDGRFKIDCTVGTDNAAPAAVLEAFDRLSKYVVAEVAGVPGASSYSIDMGQLSESITRHPAFMARALDNSGAADLLRPYRRA